jgi:aminoglycoside 3-N-acetyltransferase
MAYSLADIKAAYRAVGVKPGQVVYVTSDLAGLWHFETPGRKAVFEAHLGALTELIGSEGTLVVPTASPQLCNTDLLFDLEQTPSQGVGAFSEYVRKLPEALRSFHPFVSYAALGPKAQFITQNVSRHAFGPETPEARMIELDALCLSVGIEPRMSCSTIHHVEQVMAVPYRYTKEYLQPVRRGDETIVEPFYQHVWYRECDFERDGNRKLFERLKASMPLSAHPLGAGQVYAYKMADFVRESCRIFADDIYIWCEAPPTVRPYQR